MILQTTKVITMYKTSTYISFFLLIFLLLFQISCTKKYEDAEMLKKEITENLLLDHWKITYYERNAQDKTNDWQNTSFYFKEKDIVKIATDSSTYTGWWRFIILNEQYADFAHDYINFNIGLNTHVGIIDSLNNDWRIFSYSPNKLELRDEVKDTTLVDKLTFEKK